MKTGISQRIQTPGFVKLSEWGRGLGQRFIRRPVKRVQREYRICAAYSQARHLVDVLSSVPEYSTEFRSRMGQETDLGYITRYLGAVLEREEGKIFYRGRIARASLQDTAELVSYVLSTKFNIIIGVANIREAIKGAKTTPMQVGFPSGIRDLFWSLVPWHFPVFGLFLRLAQPFSRYDLDFVRRMANRQVELVETEESVYAEAAHEVMERKYRYVTGMVDAVIDLMDSAARGVSLDELRFFACHRIVAAITFMTRALIYQVRDVEGTEKACPVAWAGREGYHDKVVDLQAKLMGGKMDYDLIEEGVARVGSDAAGRDEKALAREIGEEALEMLSELRFATDDVSAQLAGTTSLVALSILHNRPFICDGVAIQPDGTANAVDLITGETIHPNPIGMRALNVFQFFAAPFGEGETRGTLLGAVDLPEGVTKEEILHIMEAYEAFARILGMVIENRDRTENLVAAQARLRQMKEKLEKFAPATAVRTIEAGVALDLEERNYVTAFADLRESTGHDREHQAQPAFTHAARNRIFDLVQRSSAQVTFSGERVASLLSRHPELFERAPVLGEFSFRLYDGEGCLITRENIEGVGDHELLTFWDEIRAEEERMLCETFNYQGDAILTGRRGMGEGSNGVITPIDVRAMLISSVRIARRLAALEGSQALPIPYKLKMALHGGLVSAGVLGTEERGEYTLTGLPVDLTARLLGVFGGWEDGERPVQLGCRPETGEGLTTLPIVVSGPMMRILLRSPEGNKFMRGYVGDFNDYILSGLLGNELYGLLVSSLTPFSREIDYPLASLIDAFIKNYGQEERLLKGFKPLSMEDLLKGPFSLVNILGNAPRGMREGDDLSFHVLEWDIHAYHPGRSGDFDRERRNPVSVNPATMGGVISRIPNLEQTLILRGMGELVGRLR